MNISRGNSSHSTRAPDAVRSTLSFAKASAPALLLAVMLAICTAGPAAALGPARYALVIGNSAYKSARLVNPANDAELMARTLGKLGFSVTKLIDGSQQAMTSAMIAFSRKLRGTKSVGLFYYAGHGVQVDGENYLVPVDADIASENEVPVVAVNVNDMFKTMARDGGGGINIAILDACRNNPFGEKLRGIQGGLARVLAPSGSFIAYATGPGQVALDGDKGNSPYTLALAEAMQMPGIALEEVFRYTRRKVLEATLSRQTPWESSSLTGEFFFKQKPAKLEANKRPGGSAPSVLAPDAVAELQAWQAIPSTGGAAAYEAFLERFPSGLFAELARLKLARLSDPPATAVVPGQNDTVVVSSLESRAAEAEKIFEQAGRAEAGGKPQEAVGLYFAAARLGLPAAMHALAKRYDKGRGVTRSLKIAATWYRKAADRGYAASMNALGNMHEFGEGVELSLAEALRLYQLAAEKGNAEGMTSLAFLYATGKGVARDARLARHWYLAGAENGNARAMFNLALMQIRGEGGQLDHEGAANWLQLAVAKGHAGAMRQLAALYEGGQGVGHQPRMAASLLLRSYMAGNKDARTDLVARPESWSLATRREVQRELRRRGLYRGRTSGYFNIATRKALLELLKKA